MPLPRKPALAFGRSLGDFGELAAAEIKLLDCCRAGDEAAISEERPTVETLDNRVRAEFLRFLALGGDDKAPVHEHGVHLTGAYVSGELDLSGATVEHPLTLWKCHLSSIQAFDAHLSHLALDGSSLIGTFYGDRLVCTGGIFLRNGFLTVGPVRLSGATIGGDVDCRDGRFEPTEGDALHADGAKISGGVFLRGKFHACAPVKFRGTQIGGHLDCDGGEIEAAGEVALDADGAQIAGSVGFTGGFHALGRVRLCDSRIGGTLNCDSARLEAAPKEAALTLDRAQISGSLRLTNGFHSTGEICFLNASIRADLTCKEARFESAGDALSGERVQVAGSFFFQAIRGIDGAILLSRMHVGSLVDDSASWALAKGKIVLDGFTYVQFSGPAPAIAEARIAWLELQWPDHLNSDFRPQPWEQVIAVLRAMGHPEAARTVAIAKQDRLRKAGKIVRGARLLHRLYGLMVGYGYRPFRLLAVTASIWLLCAAAYWAGTNPQRFGTGIYLLTPSHEPGRPAPPPDYANFVPLIYSADVLLPVVDFGYKKEWQPVVADAAGNPLRWGQALRFLYWFEIAFGWIAGLFLVGVLGNLIKKD